MSQPSSNLAGKCYKAIWTTGLIGAGLSLMALTLITTYSVVMRYIFGKPQAWPNEICEYLLLVSVFMGLAFVQHEKRHTRIDLITARLHPQVQKSLEMVTTALFLVYTLVLFRESWRLAWRSFRLGWVSMTLLEVPLFLPQAVIPLGTGALAAVLVFQMMEDVRSMHGESGRIKKEGGG